VTGETTREPRIKGERADRSRRPIGLDGSAVKIAGGWSAHIGESPERIDDGKIGLHTRGALDCGEVSAETWRNLAERRGRGSRE